MIKVLSRLKFCFTVWKLIKLLLEDSISSCNGVITETSLEQDGATVTPDQVFSEKRYELKLRAKA